MLYVFEVQGFNRSRTGSGSLVYKVLKAFLSVRGVEALMTRLTGYRPVRFIGAGMQLLARKMQTHDRFSIQQFIGTALFGVLEGQRQPGIWRTQYETKLSIRSSWVRVIGSVPRRGQWSAHNANSRRMQMSSEEVNQQTQAEPGSGPNAEGASAKSVSFNKIEANRRNAQQSTGPKTAEGKATSAKNELKHGIFVKQILQGAADEEVSEIELLAQEIRDCYQPVGKLEEMLVEKIVVENVRYARILGFEQQEFSRDCAFFNPAVDRVGRYATSLNRALSRTMEDLERLQAVRKARESAAVDPSADTELPPVEAVDATAGESGA
jgi:hypothetical protein